MSKASEWERARREASERLAAMNTGRPSFSAVGVAAYATATGQCALNGSVIDVGSALALARWILDTFGD